jgi:hypothetical protein
VSFVLSAAGLSVVIVTWAVWLKKALNQAVPNNLAGLVAGMLLGLGLASFAFAFQTSLLSSVIAAIALVLGAFWCASAVFGGQRTGVPKIIVGQPLPAFSARNEDGSTFHSSEMDGSLYLLKFFRGHW